MYYIDPLTITDASIIACSLAAEDATAAWVAGTYAVGDERHVLATHRVYRAKLAGSSTISPELDPTRWEDRRPTNKWAPFDIYTNTKATDTADLSYSVRARFCNSLMLRGLVGNSVEVTIRKTTGGDIAFYQSIPLKQPASGYWDYAFGEHKVKTVVSLFDLPIFAAAEITIKIIGSSTNARSIGLLALGKLLSIHGLIGGTQWGAEVQPKSYTYRRFNDDGTLTLTQRGAATDMAATVELDPADADNAVRKLDNILGRPVGFFATKEPGHDGLSAFGIASRAPVKYSMGIATCAMQIEGII